MGFKGVSITLDDIYLWLSGNGELPSGILKNIDFPMVSNDSSMACMALTCEEGFHFTIATTQNYNVPLVLHGFQ